MIIHDGSEGSMVRISGLQRGEIAKADSGHYVGFSEYHLLRMEDLSFANRTELIGVDGTLLASMEIAPE